jgi:CHAT domain-containing protein/tetratricopeptide (TPR) repeat protein
MLCVRHCLAGLLAFACAAGSTHTAATASRANASRAPRAVSPQPSISAASDEREAGRALLHRGRAAEALIHLERALAAFHASGDRSGEASTRDLLGELYERQGRYDSALENYNDALDLYVAGGKPQPKPSGKLPKEAGAKAAKVAKGAEDAASLSAEESSYNAVLMLSKMGAMLYRLGDAEDARAAYTRMGVTKPDKSVLAKTKRHWWDTTAQVVNSARSGKIEVGAGVGAVGGIFEATTQLGLYRQSILYAAKETGLGRLDLKAGQFDSARKHFQSVLDATEGDLAFISNLGQTRRYRTAARTSLADTALAEGHYKEAEKLYSDALKGAKDDKRLDLMWPAQRGRGRSLWKMAAAEKDSKKAGKLRDDALDSYRDALKTVESIRAGSIRADESRTTFLATTRDVFDEAAGALAESAIAEADGSAPSSSDGPASTRPLEGKALAYAEESLTFTEQGRARSLLDMLSEAGGEITEGVPAGLSERKRKNLQRRQEIAAKLTGVSLGADASGDDIEDAETELGALQSDYESIENEIGKADPRYAALTSPRTLTLDEIRAQVLDDQTALLEYSLGEERSYLFAVTRAGLTVSRLPPRAEVERQVTAFRRQIITTELRHPITDLLENAVDPQRGIKLRAAPPPQPRPEVINAYAQSAFALYKSVVEPAAPLFKQDRLLVVADGALNYVPFDALVSAPPQQGADFSTLPYLINTNETVFAPSASVVGAIRRQRAQGGDARAAGDVFVVADPVFDASDSRAPAARAGAQSAKGLSFDSALADVSDAGAAAEASAPRGVIVRLAGTGEEARAIEKLASASGRKADLLLDAEANESNVEGRDLRGYRFIHFATHSLLDAEHPQFTGIVLSLVGNPEGWDGFLRTDEVFNLKLSSPLVMLSACETGLGREKRGEGVMGLTRAFMYAGAPTVGVTLWSVEDKSTSELMADFYANLLGREAPAAPSSAMRAARRRMIADKRYNMPYFWAPFVLVGDWK